MLLGMPTRDGRGKPPYDPVLMFKIMVVQALYSLPDDQAEFMVQDRLSFMLSSSAWALATGLRMQR